MAHEVELVRVKHAHWIHTVEAFGWKDEDCIECSDCGEYWLLCDGMAFEDEIYDKLYCPHCGAKMDEEPERRVEEDDRL